VSTDRYLPELYYFFDQPDFPLEHALSVTAQAVSRWCEYYHAHLIVPVAGAASRQRAGRLPRSLEERGPFVDDVLDWIFTHSEIQYLFTLYLDVEPLPVKGRTAKFDHHDDTCCWVLMLTAEEFEELQAAWKANGLPQDLFYPDGAGRTVPYRGDGRLASIAQRFGANRYYTPKQWEAAKAP
jgi:hypothetical protein